MTSTPPPAGGHPADAVPPQGASRPPARVTTGALLSAVGEEVGAAGLTPAALARAVVRVLPVDGAGLSTLMSALRLPLGASSDAAQQAEELQTSLGEGPCLSAAEEQVTLVVDADELTQRWELYGQGLLARTPFRAVASIPLHAPGRGVFAALDLYSTTPTLSDRLDPAQVELLAPTAAALLTSCMGEVADADELGPGWYESATARRNAVWVAVGMVKARRGGPTGDALGLLRAHAYTTDRSLDDLAADLVEGRLRLDDVID